MNEELIWRLWNGEILVSIINGKQANYLDNLLVEFGFPIPVFFSYPENEDDWDRLYYYFVLKKNHVAQILPLSFVSLKETAIRNCPHYAKILTYDTFVKLLKDIPVEDPLQDTDVNTLI